MTNTDVVASGPPAVVEAPVTPVKAWDLWGPPLVAFLISRIGIVAVTAWSLTIDPRTHRPLVPKTWPGIEGLCLWDCGWFETIGLSGYAEAYQSNFFPLFPLLGRVVHEVTRLPMPISLVVVANIFGFLGLAGAYRLFRELEGPAVATAAIGLLVCWPFSFFQAAGYPESMMFASTAWAIYFAHKSRHLTAGTVLGLGILGRHLTVLGGASLLVAQLRERGPNPKKFLFNWSFLGLVLPFAIVSIYFVYLHFRFGDSMAWLHARDNWGDVAWWGLGTFFDPKANFEPQIRVYVILSIIPGIGAFALLRKRAWWTLAGYAIVLMLAIWSIGLAGLGRYTQACWPAFLPLAVFVTKREAFKGPIMAAFALVQGMLLYLFCHSYPIN